MGSAVTVPDRAAFRLPGGGALQRARGGEGVWRQDTVVIHRKERIWNEVTFIWGQKGLIGGTSSSSSGDGERPWEG